MITWLPVSNILPMEGIVNERSLFLPALGITGALGLALSTIRLPTRRTQVLMATLIVAAGLSARVCWRWRTSLTMWQTTVEDHPRSPFSQLALAGALVEQARQATSLLSRHDDLTSAQAHYEAALALHPEWPAAFHGLALAAALDGNCNAARPYLDRAFFNNHQIPREVQEARRLCPANPF